MSDKQKITRIRRNADGTATVLPGQGKATRRATLAEYLLPTADAANKSANRDAAEAYNKGEIARAIGASSRRAVTVPVGVVHDTLMKPIAYGLQGVGNFFGGAVGSSGDETVNITASQAGKSALDQGRKAKAAPAAKPKPAPLSPREQMLAVASTILSDGATMRDLSTLNQIVGGPTAAPSAKDQTIGSMAALSRQVYQADIARISAALASGEIDKGAAQAMQEKATEAHFNRAGGLVGFNPLNAQQAEMLQGAE